MIVDCTDEQAKQIVVNAINASNPGANGSMGWLQHEPGKTFTTRDVEIHGDRLTVDYFMGRMVKLSMRRLETPNRWDIYFPSAPRADYQSWAITYPTIETLVDSVLKKEVA